MLPKTGILLVNLGTPKTYGKRDVFRYLIEFLTDPRVLDLPWWKRQFLTRCVIAPFRYRQTARSYEEIWTEEGSPLLAYGRKAQYALQKELGSGFLVDLAMRYQTPSIPERIEFLLSQSIERLVVFPLFPQYASATTGSAHQKILETLSRYERIPQLFFIDQYACHPAFIDAFCAVGKRYALEEYDHILFSFHGLPQRHVIKANPQGSCLRQANCCALSCQENRNCYSAQCHRSAQGIARGLGLSLDQFTICYQSRLGKEPWLQPYASETLEKMLRKGYKKILVFSPSFVCDCLETLFEIGKEYEAEFKKKGGEKLDLVSGLNAEPAWINAIQRIIFDQTPA